ncbi:hypothetical protein [Actinophytocola oryzae]|uniref:Helix-hairpin-helix protein n=1 Tax=Actinophytocola oryzae TaxID=502181 RepID=A0A4R7W297_9PSEU|nr:hypothetical protein [Actinophytocola oryzae]TDV56624.1 hypothetical protein CLV71_102691 [Actinophytocola oryzae]
MKGRWYYVVTVCSLGLLAWLPFVHAGTHLRRRSVTMLACGYGLATVVIGTLLAVTPTDENGKSTNSAVGVVGVLLMMATVALGCVQQSALRREVYSGAPPKDTVDPALAAALEARERRENARRIAARDPLLARDLKIGRPDLTRTFDDGGLVDLNSAAPRVIAESCDLPVSTGEDIAAVRPPGGFLTVDDVLSLAEIPVAAWDIIRDRAVTIPRPDWRA